jgi:hypothetical protein
VGSGIDWLCPYGLMLVHKKGDKNRTSAEEEKQKTLEATFD